MPASVLDQPDEQPDAPELQSPAAAPFAPVTMRSFSDPAATRDLLYANTLAAAKRLPPVSNTRHTLTVSDIGYEGPASYSLAKQKQAILAGRSLTRSLRGTYDLTDNATGQSLAKRRVTIARIPHMTERGTFIVGGNEYALSSQMRLRPGVFSRQQDNGHYESHINVKKGLGHRIFLDPESGIFRVKFGQAEIPLLPLLRTMGVQDQQLREAWGNELAAVNMHKDDPQAIGKLYKKLLGGKAIATDQLSQKAAVAQAVNSMELDPEVTARTLGTAHTHVTPEALLDTTKKLLRISRGEDEPDDRDAMAFQKVVGPEDLFAERFDKAHEVGRRALWKASASQNLDRLHPGLYDEAVKGVLMTSGLASPLEEINPLELLDQQTRITRMGEGGITSMDAVPKESRSVQPSHLGYIDFLRTPESGRVGVDARLARAARKGSDGRLYTPVRDLRTNQITMQSPQDLADQPLAFPGEMERGEPVVAALSKGRIRMVPREHVRYVVPHMEDAFSPLGNLIPLKSLVKGQRAVMGSRMLAQALPLVHAEAPLVQSGLPEDPSRSFEEEYSKHLGAVFSPDHGLVMAVSPAGIKVRYANGKTQTHELYTAFPFNRKTLLHNTPTVQPGEQVRPGQLLAKSNYTDDKGTAALGLNARVAYMSRGGDNFEDATVISQSLANRLTSEHMYQHGIDWDESHQRGKKAFVSLFPATYDKATLEKFSDQGVIKPGTEVNFGDPLILTAQKKESNRKTLLRGRPSFADATVTWEHHSPGIVTDVRHDDKGAAVIVKAESPTQEGDKLSGKYGDKGIVSKIVPDHEMPQDSQGRPFELLINPLGITSRTNPAQLVEAALGKIAAQTGQPYKIQDFGNEADMSEFARRELEKHGVPDTESVTDPQTGRRIDNVFTGNRWFMKLHHVSESKQAGRGLGAYTSEGLPARGGAAGCFIGSQKIDTISGPVRISAICERRQSIHVRTFSPTLQEWVYRPVTDWFVRRAKVTDIRTIEVAGGPCSTDSRVNRTTWCLYPTVNHELLMADGRRKLAGDVRVGDSLTTWGLQPTPDQWAMMLGSLLGDASVNTNYFMVEHSVKQVEYVRWKQAVLAGLCPDACDTEHRGDGPNTLPSLRNKRHLGRQVRVAEDHVVRSLRHLCYPEGKKRICQEWLDRLNDFSVVVWLLDDGSITNNAKKAGLIAYIGSLATHGFTRQDADWLACWLTRRYGAMATIHANGAVGLSAELCRRLIQLVAVWIPWTAIPKSKPFLIRQVRAIQEAAPPRQLQTVSVLGCVPLRVVDVRAYVHDKPVAEINVYDMTVAETHTYVAGCALVSNSKRIGMLELSSLLSHGATAVIRDAKLLRGQANPQFWSQYMAGFKPATPDVPHVYEKFVNSLKAAGINPLRQGTQTRLMAMTDKDVDELVGDRELQNAETVNWRNMEPIAGGLFDRALTGGHMTPSGGGNRWSKITLNEPLPNPVFEDPICRVLGLTRTGFHDILGGKQTLHSQTGPEAIASALDKIDLPRELSEARQQISSGKKTARDQAIRRFGFLKSAEQLGIHPRDWILSQVPVLPPAFRPISTMGPKKLPLIADPNFLYRELFDANQNLKDVKETLGDDQAYGERANLYDAFKAVVGLGEPTQPKNQERRVQGLLAHIFGSSPKHSTLQRKLLGSAVDLVGRAAISPDPNLDMDHVGLPENAAWSIYRPIVIRSLVRAGMPRLAAARAVEDRSAAARKTLLEEMENGVVVYNRAPTLHRYGIIAARPVLSEGHVLKVSPLMTKGAGADFDGDCMQFHVPVSDEARQEALDKLLPSRNLLGVANFKPMYQPTQEYVGGLYEASAQIDKSKPPLVFADKKAAIQAYREGRVGVGRRVEIMDQ